MYMCAHAQQVGICGKYEHYYAPMAHSSSAKVLKQSGVMVYVTGVIQQLASIWNSFEVLKDNLGQLSLMDNRDQSSEVLTLL